MRFYQPIFTKDAKLFVKRRVSLIGKVLDVIEREKYTDITLADPYGKILVRSFEGERPSLFSTILVLGRCTEFSGKIYIITDKIIPLNVEEEIFWRRAHLNKYKILSKKTKQLKTFEESKEIEESERSKEIEVKSLKDLRSKVLKAIEHLDKGNGVSIEEISKYLEEDISKIQKIVEELLALGEIYETSLGKLKILK